MDKDSRRIRGRGGGIEEDTDSSKCYVVDVVLSCLKTSHFTLTTTLFSQIILVLFLPLPP